jgi:hypothetical protein
MKKVRKLPSYKKWTSQLRILIDGKEYKVYQSLRSYALAKKSRMFINLNGEWFELDDKEKLDVY